MSHHCFSLSVVSGCTLRSSEADVLPGNRVMRLPLFTCVLLCRPRLNVRVACRVGCSPLVGQATKGCWSLRGLHQRERTH